MHRDKSHLAEPNNRLKTPKFSIPIGDLVVKDGTKYLKIKKSRSYKTEYIPVEWIYKQLDMADNYQVEIEGDPQYNHYTVVVK